MSVGMVYPLMSRCSGNARLQENGFCIHLAVRKNRQMMMKSANDRTQNKSRGGRNQLQIELSLQSYNFLSSKESCEKKVKRGGLIYCVSYEIHNNS